MKLIEVKVFEKAKDTFSDRDSSLDGMFNHPDRWRYTNCFKDCYGRVCVVGGQGMWEFDESGYCANFACMGDAWIIGDIDESRTREPDRFVAVDENNPAPI